MNGPASPWERFWSAKRDLATVYPSSPRVLEAILEWIPAGAPRVLEIGAGSGRDAAALAASGARAIALDRAPASLALIARAHPSLRGRSIVGGDAIHLPFGDGAFDAVFHQGVLEHFGNPHAFLVENFRVLRPGGLLVVDVPQRWHPWTALKHVALRFDRWFAGWETEFSVDELETLVQGAGFACLDRYADTMVPSLAYRLVREAAGKAGVRLPLRPPAPSAWREARERGRRRWLASAIAPRVAHTIGVVARRP
jgi:SAM-dependent methyltransferase